MYVFYSLFQLANMTQILSLFERLPLGIRHGHFYAMLRLAAWAQRGHTASRELMFVQTEPAQSRRRRGHGGSRVSSTTSVVDRDMTPVRTGSLQRSQSLSLSHLQPTLPPHAQPMPTPLEVPKAPPRPVPDDHAVNRRDTSSSTYNEPELGYHKVVFSPSEPRLVRPMPVVARPPGAQGTPHIVSLDEAEAQQSAQTRAHDSKPATGASVSDVQLPPAPTLLRPSAPMPMAQQVSPLIQASLNARSEFKKASRQSRPKTFTVLSSSSGQFQPDKPHLLNGEVVSPHLLSPDTKRRTTSATKLSSQIASQDLTSPYTPHVSAAAAHPINESLQGQTIAPKPSYFGRERGVLPAWLREQYEEGNVLYPPPDPADSSVTSVFDALDNKAHHTMNGSERAAASINRNTPFFPPHERDRERAERTTLNGTGPAQYRKLNEETSVGKRSSNESLGQERVPKLSGSRSKGILAAKGRRLEHSQSQYWGTQLESGTYAGFKSMPSTRDLRLQLPPRISTKRSFQIRPTQEFQPLLAPPPPPPSNELQTHASTPSQVPPAPSSAQPDPFDNMRMPEEVEKQLASQDNTRTDSAARPFHADVPRLSRTQSWNTRQPEVHRFMLQEDATRSQLTQKHERKLSGSFAFGTPLVRRASQRQGTPRDESGPSGSAERGAASRSLTQMPAPATPRQELYRDLGFFRTDDASMRKGKKRVASTPKLKDFSDAMGDALLQHPPQEQPKHTTEPVNAERHHETPASQEPLQQDEAVWRAPGTAKEERLPSPPTDKPVPARQDHDNVSDTSKQEAHNLRMPREEPRAADVQSDSPHDTCPPSNEPRGADDAKPENVSEDVATTTPTTDSAEPKDAAAEAPAAARLIPPTQVDRSPKSMLMTTISSPAISSPALAVSPMKKPDHTVKEVANNADLDVD